ncbi:hypothetical protein BCR42DRAFT_402352 [Absidia repens]|uniref:Uncharacterized protein n=1 Tax=Absidia repens TaxID=90262 RepID=A0A1X2IZM3_9FUNG|nr:hypothetical protein BCR42DRAFT_402352 [Absidia repens]
MPFHSIFTAEKFVIHHRIAHCVIVKYLIPPRNIFATMIELFPLNLPSVILVLQYNKK